MSQRKIIQGILDPFALRATVEERNREMRKSLEQSDLQTMTLHAHFKSVGDYLNNAMSKVGKELDALQSTK